MKLMLTKLQRPALRGVRMLSTYRNRNEVYLSDFLEPPTSHWSSGSSAAAEPSTRIVCMSDTHGQHSDIPFLPPGDVLVHAGDLTKNGETSSVEDLSRYFQFQREARNYQNILCIAGNQDVTLHEDYYEKTTSRPIRSQDPSEARAALRNCTYLEDSGIRLAQGDLVAYGSPWTPYLFKWGFNLPRGEELQKVWSKIPSITDILITHGPPHGRGDFTSHSGHFGCEDLLSEVQERVQPRLHIFGHIKEGYGTSSDGKTLYVNASSLDLGYEANNHCIVVDLPHDKDKPAVVVEPQCWIDSEGVLVDWLKQNCYFELAQVLDQQVKPKEFPLGNDLLSESAFSTICDKLALRKKTHPARKELRRALGQLYAESFLPPQNVDYTNQTSWDPILQTTRMAIHDGYGQVHRL